MIVLTIRTDKPESEVGLFSDGQKLEYESWQAHRTLSQSIHKKIEDLLKSQKLDWHEIKGVICYKGPGSFTGLRIGIAVANTLAGSLNVPIVGQSGKNWIEAGLKALKSNLNDTQVLPEYGSPAHVTLPKK